MDAEPLPAPTETRSRGPNVDQERILDRYADLALRIGVGFDAGRRVHLRAPLEAAPLARRIVRTAYRGGAPYVHVAWNDEEVARTRFLEAPDGTFDELPPLQAEAMEAMADRGWAFVSIDASDPELLIEADAARVATARAAASRSLAGYRRRMMANAVPWTIVAAPTPAWARQVFPDAPADEAVDRLWAAIATATRLDANDPVAAWREHVDALATRTRYLNERRYHALRFTGPGTDLTVGLADRHVWHGGASRTPDGTRFVPNVPTEEVFTAPHRDRTEGVVRASRPLYHGGRRIDGFELRFERGVCVSARAEVGQEVLDRLLDTDEGARRLGEVALVPVGGPIERSGTVFRNTLFDENAASHLAFGQAYRFCLEAAADEDDAAVRACGANESLVHADFMIGDAEVDVDGVGEDGARSPLMREGRFVID